MVRQAAVDAAARWTELADQDARLLAEDASPVPVSRAPRTPTWLPCGDIDPVYVHLAQDAEEELIQRIEELKRPRRVSRRPFPLVCMAAPAARTYGAVKEFDSAFWTGPTSARII